MSEGEDRGRGLTVFTIIIGITGLLLIACGMGSSFSMQPLAFLGYPGPYMSNIGGMIILLGFVYLGIAYGFWTLKQPALYVFMMILLGLIVWNFSCGYIFGIVVDIIMLGYCWFSRGTFGGYGL